MPEAIPLSRPAFGLDRFDPRISRAKESVAIFTNSRARLLAEPDSENRQVHVVGHGIDAHFETDGKRVWRPDPILIELDGLTINQARQLIKRKGWRAFVVR